MSQPDPLETMIATLPPEARKVIQDFREARPRVMLGMLNTPLDEPVKIAALIRDVSTVRTFLIAMREVSR